MDSDPFETQSAAPRPDSTRIGDAEDWRAAPRGAGRAPGSSSTAASPRAPGATPPPASGVTTPARRR
ncbi:MAG: hypothetical protein ACYDA2_03090, partial [Acidimicrobiales bacterium]